MLGRSHPSVRRARALRRDGALREAEGVLLAEGIHLAEEALAASTPIEIVWVSPRLSAIAGGASLRARLEGAAAEIHEVPDRLLDSLQDARSPQPVLLLVRRPLDSLESVLRGRGAVPLLVIAAGVQDPGNLGALVRTADAAGATGFVAARGGADPLHPRAVRATMGSVFRLPLARAAAADLPGVLRSAGVRAVGAVPRAASDYRRLDWTAPTALLVGGEGAGLPADLLEAMDDVVSIPTHPGVESLSVGAAAAVLLFEAKRQRDLSCGG